jgi:hypothetical protein
MTAARAAQYNQELVGQFELPACVPDTTRKSFERVQNLYAYGVLSYDLFTVAGDQAKLALEQALGTGSCPSTTAPPHSGRRTR